MGCRARASLNSGDSLTLSRQPKPIVGRQFEIEFLRWRREGASAEIVSDLLMLSRSLTAIERSRIDDIARRKPNVNAYAFTPPSKELDLELATDNRLRLPRQGQ